ncbi:MAG: flagellar hook-length control protein FliK [Lachnospiraceae bacterium]|nr:flagellar hook-length control protein FliK [Lachnospiraceae bacterium]
MLNSGTNLDKARGSSASSDSDFSKVFSDSLAASGKNENSGKYTMQSQASSAGTAKTARFKQNNEIQDRNSQDSVGAKTQDKQNVKDKNNPKESEAIDSKNPKVNDGKKVDSTVQSRNGEVKGDAKDSTSEETAALIVGAEEAIRAASLMSDTVSVLEGDQIETVEGVDKAPSGIQTLAGIDKLISNKELSINPEVKAAADQAVEGILTEIKDTLNVTEEDIDRAVQSLGMEEADLLEPSKIKDLVPEILNKDKSLILVDEGLYKDVQTLVKASEDSAKVLVEKTGLNIKEIQDLLLSPDSKADSQEIQIKMLSNTAIQGSESVIQDGLQRLNFETNQDQEIIIQENGLQKFEGEAQGTIMETVDSPEVEELNKNTIPEGTAVIQETEKTGTEANLKEVNGFETVENEEAVELNTPVQQKGTENKDEEKQGFEEDTARTPAETVGASEEFPEPDGQPEEEEGIPVDPIRGQFKERRGSDIPMELKIDSETIEKVREEQRPKENQPKLEEAPVIRPFGETLIQAVRNTVSQSISQPDQVLNTTQNIINQIQDQIKINVRQSVSTIEMQLNPENLGKVLLHIESKAGVITAQFTAQNATVKEALESQIASLRTNLEEQGVKVEKVEVEVSTRAFDQNFLNNGGQGEAGQFEQNQNEMDRTARLRRINQAALGEEGFEGEEIDPIERLMSDRAHLNLGESRIDFTA